MKPDCFMAFLHLMLVTEEVCILNSAFCAPPINMEPDVWGGLEDHFPFKEVSVRFHVNWWEGPLQESTAWSTNSRRSDASKSRPPRTQSMSWHRQRGRVAVEKLGLAQTSWSMCAKALPGFVGET